MITVIINVGRPRSMALASEISSIFSVLLATNGPLTNPNDPQVKASFDEALGLLDIVVSDEQRWVCG